MESVNLNLANKGKCTVMWGNRERHYLEFNSMRLLFCSIYCYYYTWNDGYRSIIQNNNVLWGVGYIMCRYKSKINLYIFKKVVWV